MDELHRSGTPPTTAPVEWAPSPSGWPLKSTGDRDWPTIRARYVEGVHHEGRTEWPTLADVAAYYGVGYTEVSARSAKEGWTEQRSRYQAQVERARQAERVKQLAEAAVALDRRALKACELGLELCIGRLERLHSHTFDALEQQRVATAVDLWHRIGLRAVGDPETTRVEITGADGRPLSIAQELQRDDPNRLAGVLDVLAQAGLGDLFGRGEVGGSRTLEDGSPANP